MKKQTSTTVFMLKKIAFKVTLNATISSFLTSNEGSIIPRPFLDIVKTCSCQVL